MLSDFEKAYGGKGRIKKPDSAEILFLKALGERDTKTAISFFRDRKQVTGKSAIYTPHKNYFGLKEIEECVNTYYDHFPSSTGYIIPVTQTICGLLHAIEFVWHITLSDTEEKVIPMACVAELYCEENLLDEIRFYMNPLHLEDYPRYRCPIFAEHKTYDLREEMLSGLMPAYFELIRKKGMSHIPDIMTQKETVMWGGYSLRPVMIKTQEELRQYIKERDRKERTGFESPSGLDDHVRIRIEKIIDDGKICCIEWEQLVTRRGRSEKGRLSMPGISFYERAKDGFLKSWRIIDYAGMERSIRWDKSPITKEEAEAINYIDI